MAERFQEPAAQRTTNEPVEPTGEIARKNVALGLALVAVALLIATGAVIVSLVYLHYD
jgi:hypothetical protein